MRLADIPKIENCLLSHPNISDVSVVGVADERYGETVAAFIIKAESSTIRIMEEDVRNWVRERMSKVSCLKYQPLMLKVSFSTWSQSMYSSLTTFQRLPLVKSRNSCSEMRSQDCSKSRRLYNYESHTCHSH